MKRISLFLLITLLSLPSFAQTWEEITANKEILHAEGWGSSINEADEAALSALMSQIVVNVQTDKTVRDESVNRNGDIEESSTFLSSIKTYTQGTLANTTRVIIENEPNARVGRWIKRSEIEKIFASRIDKVRECIENAQMGERLGKADDALRNYYYALTLLKSLRYPDEVKHVCEDGKSHMLSTWIPTQMNAVFDQLKAQVVKRENCEVELLITFKGKKVNSVDYTYFDGANWSALYSAKDGCGSLELDPNFTGDDVRLKYEFEYRGQAHDRELEAVFAVVKSTSMPHAYVTLPLEVKEEEELAESCETFSSTPSDELEAPTSISSEAAEEYMKIIASVMNAVKTKNHAAVRTRFTDEGWGIYQQLIAYGKARVVGETDFQFYKNNGRVVARGVKMAFSFARGVRKSFTEDVVFTFNGEKQIECVAFGLGDTAADDILNKGVWNEAARVALMEFLENYKTAYGLKRIDYLRSIFDDDAVIIVGNVVRKPDTASDIMGSLSEGGNKIIKRNRVTKDDYLRNLERCFKSNEYINIRFANNDVFKMRGGGEVYAIQIKQDYYSTNYGDEGYLFLMVDINDPLNPIIKVRTWQPEKDPNFGIYSPGNF